MINPTLQRNHSAPNPSPSPSGSGSGPGLSPSPSPKNQNSINPSPNLNPSPRSTTHSNNLSFGALAVLKDKLGKAAKEIKKGVEVGIKDGVKIFRVNDDHLFGDENESVRAAYAKRDRQLKNEETQRANDQLKLLNATDLLSSLDPRYFTEDFDALRSTLMELPDEYDSHLEQKVKQLNAIKSVIDKKLSNEVMKNYEGFVDGMNHIREVKSELKEIHALSQVSRDNLKRVDEQFVTKPLGVLQGRRKIKRLHMVISALGQVNSLISAESNINTYLVDGKLIEAVDIYRKSLSKLAASGLKKFTALDDLRKRFTSASSAITSALHKNLFALLKTFNQGQCENVLGAIIALGDGEIKVMPDLIKKYLPLVVDEVCIQAILPSISKEINMADAKAKRFSDLINLIDYSKFRSTFLNMLASLNDIMYSFFKINEIMADKLANTDKKQSHFQALKATSDTLNEFIKPSRSQFDSTHLTAYHNNNMPTASPINSPTNATSNNNNINSSTSNNNASISSLGPQQSSPSIGSSPPPFSVWALISSRLLTVLNGIYLKPTSLSIDDFLIFLNSGLNFVSLGEAYSKLNSDGLRGAFNTNSKKYIRNFSKDTITNLKSTMEVDLWTIQPVESTFSAKDLIEFQDKFNIASKNSVSRINETAKQLGQGSSNDPLVSSLILTESRVIWLVEQFQRGENAFLIAKRHHDFVEENKLKEAEKERELQRGTAVTSVQSGGRKALNGGAGVRPSGSTVSAIKLAPNPLELWGGLATDASTPVITLSNLAAARSVGRYLSLMNNLPSSSLESLNSVQEIFEFYVYSIFTMFGFAQHNFFDPAFSKYMNLKKLVNLVKNKVEAGTFGAGVFKEMAVKENVAGDRGESLSPHGSKDEISSLSNQSAATVALAAGKLNPALSNTSQKANVFTVVNALNRFKEGISRVASSNELSKSSYPHLVELSSMIDLDDEKTNCGVINRIVATESLLFIGRILNDSRDRIKSMLPQSDQSKGDEFFAYIQSCVKEFRIYMYRNVAPIMVRSDLFLSKLTSCKWDIKELASKPSPYVETIINSVRDSAQILNNNGGLPPSLRNHLWTESLSYLMEKLIEVYSSSKKCSSEGRGLMGIDLTKLKSELEKILNLRPLPGWDYIHEWVNSFYLNDKEFLRFIQEHVRYTESQMMNVANDGPASVMGRKQKSDFIAAVTQALKINAEIRAKNLPFKSSNGFNPKSNNPTPGPTSNLTAPAVSASASALAITHNSNTNPNTNPSVSLSPSPSPPPSPSPWSSNLIINLSLESDPNTNTNSSPALGTVLHNEDVHTDTSAHLDSLSHEQTSVE